MNFWIPSAPPRKLIEPRTLWLLKLHRVYLPYGTIVDPIACVGVFMHYSVLPLQMACDAFGIRNGVPTLAAFRNAIMHHKPPGADSWNTDVGVQCLMRLSIFRGSFARRDRGGGAAASRWPGLRLGEELQTEAFLSIDSRPPGRLSISIGRVYRKSD